jgi:small subunit ribosomal protein S17
MSETENEQTTEPGETVETDVETAAQPEGSQPTEIPAAEPETSADEVPAEDEAPAEPEAAAEAPAERAAEESSPEAPTGAPSETPAAEGSAQPAREPRRRSRRHVPRSLRRQRTRPAKADGPKERKPIVRLEKPEHERGRSQERRGVVVSDAMDKTIVVKVESVRAHQRYKKVIRRSVKFHAHDEQNQAHVGDRVRIVETRPLSKTKRWRLAEIIEVAK